MFFFKGFVLTGVSALALLAQQAVVEPPPPKPGTLAVDPNAPADKRAFGVLPNYRTAEMNGAYHPITVKRKMTIALKDSFDYPLLGTGAIYASIYHLENSHPQFGQGIQGYAKRLGTSYTDQVVGNMMSEGVLPSLFHEDPRYFRMVDGSIKKRAWYAVSRIFVTRTDSNKPTFNFAEVLGNGTAVITSWSYYTDARTAPSYFQGLGTQLGTDALSQVLKEFWPDVKRHFKKNRTSRI